MKKRLEFLISILFVAVFLMPLAYASFQLGNKSFDIQESYSSGENLKGWVNISFSNELINSRISSNFAGGINLIDFLDSNIADYNCIPSDCSENYASSNAGTNKSFSLNYGQEKIISFVLKGKINQISGLSFDVSVSNQLSCISPIKIDILDDNSIEFSSGKVGSDYSCVIEGGKGCFDSSASLSEVYIATTPYCEKISLPQSEKFKLGAWVKKGTTAWTSGLLQMVLYDLENNELENCDLPEPSATGGEISCNIDYSNKEIKDYYVCLIASANTNYVTKTEDSGTNCGFYAVPGEQTDYNDYWIFAKGAKFENTGILTINQEEYEAQGNEGSLAEYLSNYILERYNNNCSFNCSIPVRIKAYQNLNVIASNLNLAYSTTAGQQTPETKIYDTAKQSALITSDFLELDLSLGNITVPTTYGNYTLALKLNEQEIGVSRKIKVENTPVIKSLSPLSAGAGVSTKFIVNVSVPSGRNITSYNWDFGDDTEEEETNVNHIMHTYSSIGNYDLSIEVEDNLGFKTSRIFTIAAGNPKNLVNSTIQKYKKNLNNITISLASFPSWYKTKIEEGIGLESLEDELNSLEQQYISASSDDEYIEIMSNLSELDVPNAIKESLSGEIPFFVSAEDINLAYLKDFGAGNYDETNELEYQEAVAAWTQENLDLELDFRYISAYYDDRIETLVSVFNLKITPNEDLDKEFYVIIGSSNIVFGSQESTQEFDDSTGVKFSGISERNLEFAILESAPIDSLVLYLSPKFSQLEIGVKVECNPNGMCEKDLGENWRNCREDCKPWGWVTILLVILLALAIAAYIFLQWWYKHKYEGSLFKNRNDIYNLLNFISNAKSQKIQDSEIIRKLKQAGWKGEQISYVFKKMQGKAIMPFDFLKLFQKKEQRFK